MEIADEIRTLAARHASTLRQRVAERLDAMEHDDDRHLLIYRVLGVNGEEGRRIDRYRNQGRFLYKYAGSFLEAAAVSCFRRAFPAANSVRVPNTQGTRPKTFEIDCLIEADALEIKWRDATTDGDHITKEHARVRAIRDAGYRPIRVMFFEPNRRQAIRIQQTLETLYAGIGGEFHAGTAAWQYIATRTGIDLHGILEGIAAGNER